MNNRILLDELFRQFWDDMRGLSTLETLGENWHEVTLPLVDSHNDCLQIHIKCNGERLLLTDDAYIIRDLNSSGCDIANGRRRELLNTIRRGFGMADQPDGDNSISIASSPDAFSNDLLNLVQTMLAVNSLSSLTRSNVQTIFREDVEEWLDNIVSPHDLEKSKSIIGKSKTVQKFDFFVPASTTKPDRFLQSINTVTKNTIKSFLFSWNDIQEEITEGSTLYAILNDERKAIAQRHIRALRSYDVIPVLWSERRLVETELAA